MSGLVTTMLLVAISVSISAVVFSGYMGISYDTLECSINSASIFEITDSAYFVTVDAFNNGDTQITSWQMIVNYDGSQYSDTANTGGVSPGEGINFEFTINDSIDSDEAIVSLEVSNDNNSAVCSRVVEI